MITLSFIYCTFSSAYNQIYVSLALLNMQQQNLVSSCDCLIFLSEPTYFSAFILSLPEKAKIFSLYRSLKLFGPTLRFYYLHQLIIRNEGSEKFSWYSWFSDSSTLNIFKLIVLCQIPMYAGLTEPFWFSSLLGGGESREGGSERLLWLYCWLRLNYNRLLCCPTCGFEMLTFSTKRGQI